MTVHFLVSGSLFFWVIIGIDPAPHKLPHVARLVLLFVTMPFHAFFGIALMSMTAVLAADWYDQLGRTWGASAISDQQTGGAIAWGFGEIPTLVVLIALAFQWWRDDDRRARRADRRADAAAARDGEPAMPSSTPIMTTWPNSTSETADDSRTATAPCLTATTAASR